MYSTYINLYRERVYGEQYCISYIIDRNSEACDWCGMLLRVSLVRVEPYDVHFILNKVDKPLKSMQKLNQLLN